jgi:hypothetical protein
MSRSLVQPLLPGPIDIVADVHGEIEALNHLLGHLGYREGGTHPERRRLVFLGDLTDRGPDSPAVVALVRKLVDDGLAQCVLGNHDLNVLLGERRDDNNWFFGTERRHEGHPVPEERFVNERDRTAARAFFRRLPLVLERPGLRVVHACWRDEMVDVARQATDVLELYHRYAGLIEANNAVREGLDDIALGLDLQNRNPVKILTSGPERRVAVPFPDRSGKLRHEERVPWWSSYAGPECCVYGHYAALPGEPHRWGRAVCIDYDVAGRYQERLGPGFTGAYRGKLAALRFPEMRVVFDDGTVEQLPCNSTPTG